MKRALIAIGGMLALLAVCGIGIPWWSSTSEWRTPIKFYGKVVDERGAPLPNAMVELSCNDLSFSGTSNYHLTSDNNGLFAISRIRGKLLMVNVAKSGFYTSKADNNAFYYAGQNVNFIPNSAKPEVFHLRQIGIAEPLIHIQSPLGGGKDFRINKNGEPVEVSLMSGQKVTPGRGDLRVECWTEEPKNGWKFDWRCRITVINGGIQQYTNEFPFLAPLSGYAATDEIKMPVSLGEQWGPGAKRNYFLVLSNRNYARMTFEMIAHGDHFFEMESLLNPSGSRNLEFDGNKVIQMAN